MKKIILIITTLFTLSNNAQINVIKLNAKDYEALKNSTTYFIIPEFDTDKKQAYMDILKSVWSNIL